MDTVSGCAVMGVTTVLCAETGQPRLSSALEWRSWGR